MKGIHLRCDSGEVFLSYPYFGNFCKAPGDEIIILCWKEVPGSDFLKNIQVDFRASEGNSPSLR